MKQEDLNPSERPAAVAADATAGRPGAERASKDDPESLRREIEETREDLGDTVEALSQKADVKAQVSAKVDERKAALKQKVGGVRERASGATPDDAKRAAAQIAHKTEERPFPAVGVALGIGLLLGWLFGRR
jgi:ElaB/YqjD/DUF883 family membrane-anchored ribosome-binding protein